MSSRLWRLWLNLVTTIALFGVATAFSDELSLVKKERSTEFVPDKWIVEFKDPDIQSRIGYIKAVLGKRSSSSPHEEFRRYLTARKTGYEILHDYNLPGFAGTAVRLEDTAQAEILSEAPAVKSVRQVRLFERPDLHAVIAPLDAVKALVTDRGSASAEAPSDEIMSLLQPFESKGKAARANVAIAPHVMGGVDKLHAQGIFGKGQTIGILDTGVDCTHPALNGGKASGVRCFGSGCPIVGGYDFVGNDYNGTNKAVEGPDPCISCPSNSTSSAGHGTHVSGIIIGNDTTAGFTGVAPEALIRMYRIFGCKGTAGDDVILAALEKALNDKVDLISVSIGSTSGWKEGKDASIASQISDSGTPVVVSAGNDGKSGSYVVNDPGTGSSVIAVGAFENTEVLVQHAQIEPPPAGGAKFLRYLALNSFGTALPAGNKSLEVFATSKELDVLGDACKPLPDSTPDLKDKVVLVSRGLCPFATKAKNVSDKGGKFLLVYDDFSGNFIYLDEAAKVKLALINHVDGATLKSAIAAGQKVSLDFSETESYVLSEGPGFGQSSSYSAIGPDFENFFKPEISGPGGNILSSYLNQSYALVSGTSMSAPFVAGAVALYRSVHGNSVSSVDLREALTSTAKLSGSFPVNGSRIESLARQGAGLINAFNAITTRTTVSPALLALNNTDNFKGKHTITVKNLAKDPQTYEISHIPAGTFISINRTNSLFNEYPIPLVDIAASVKFSTQQMTIAAGQSAQVDLTFEPPVGSSEADIPIYSGVIRFSSTHDHGTVQVAYMGVVTRSLAVPIIETSSNALGYQLPALLDKLNNTIQNDSQLFNITKKEGPVFNFRLHFGTALVNVTVVRADGTSASPSKNGPLMRGASPALMSRDLTRGSDSDFVGYLAKGEWRGRSTGHKTLPDDDPDLYSYPLSKKVFPEILEKDESPGFYLPPGKYRIKLKTLKWLQDPSLEGSYESYLSPVFTMIQ